MNFYTVLQKPIVTEKTASMEESGRYVFQIDKAANKIQVKHAFQHFYGVMPKSVNIYYTQEKISERRGLKRKSKKRAVITLEKGKTIDLTSIK